MPKKKFKITNAGSSSDSTDLVDCHLEEVDGGYELVEKRVVLGTSSTTTPPFSIDFQYEGYDWTLNVDSATASNMGGTWSNNHNPGPKEEADSWTASGSGTEEGDNDEARATSAGK